MGLFFLNGKESGIRALSELRMLKTRYPSHPPHPSCSSFLVPFALFSLVACDGIGGGSDPSVSDDDDSDTVAGAQSIVSGDASSSACEWEEHLSADGQTASRICVKKDDPRAADQGMNDGVGWLISEELLEKNPLALRSEDMPEVYAEHERQHRDGKMHEHSSLHKHGDAEAHGHVHEDDVQRQREESLNLEERAEERLERSSGDYPNNCRWWKYSSLTATTLSQSCGSQKVFSGGCYITGSNPSTHLSRTQPYEASYNTNQPEENETLEHLARSSGWVCQRYNVSGSYSGRMYVNALCCDHD